MTEVADGRILVVAAASRHGGTCEIADRLAQTLQHDLGDAWTVLRPELSDLTVLDDADAVILGSAIYFGHWMRAATRALAYIRDAPLFDLWLFSTGPLSDVASENAAIIAMDSMVESGQAIEHRVFGGRLDPSRLSQMERAVVKLAHAIPGDRRDWDEVDQWARHIASQLAHVPPVPGTKGTPDQDAVL